MHRFCLGLLWQHGGNTVVKKNPPVFPPPFLFCSSSDNCLQQKMSCRHLAPRGREARYSPPNRHTCIHTRTHTHTKWLSVCLWESGIWSCTCTHSYSAWLSMDVPVRCTMCLCCIIIVCLWAGVVCQSPPGPSLLWLVLLKQQTAWAHTHTHTRTSSEQPWSQADRDRQRLGEVERTAWGCLQTRGNTPPSHRNSGVEAKNSNPPSAIQLCLPPVCHSAHQLLNCSSFFLFLFLPLHLFNNLYVLFFCSWIHQRHQSCIDKTNASAV